jgi:[ribosomal protein S18]-alanine N-acetyltransferase
MPYAIRPMRESDARAIAEWRYPGVYAFYDADQDPDDLAELLDPAGWGREYFAADDDAGRLAGFFVFKSVGEAVDVGLGLRPDLVGAGLGLAFLQTGLRFATEALGARAFELRVAAFNRRAITVYERAGFGQVEHYEHATNGRVHPFIRMRRPGSLPPR